MRLRPSAEPAARSPSPPATSKGERTRGAIADAALELFLERGYEKTTMRAVAERAGVALGNAYYYYGSKEHLVQAFYARTHEEHLALCEPMLATEKRFAERLRRLLVLKVETAAPYHRFSGLLFRTAADPRSPLNPFSGESAELREQATALMARVIEGSELKLPPDLARELPALLWLYEMAVILFWVHDDSAGFARTLRLIDRTVDLVAKLTKLASNPLLKPLRTSLLKLLVELRAPA
jgi:AcrR family transcriptional regulator